MGGQSGPKSGCCGCGFCCWVIVGASIFLSLLGLILLVNAYRPMAPLIKFESFSVSSLKNTSATAISTTFHITFQLINHRYYCYYSNWEVSIYYKGIQIGSAFLPQFEMGNWAKDSKSMKIEVSSAELDRVKVEGLNMEKSKGAVTFTVDMKANTEYKWSRHYKSSVWHTKEACADVPVMFDSPSSDGKMAPSVASRYCRNSVDVIGKKLVRI